MAVIELFLTYEMLLLQLLERRFRVRFRTRIADDGGAEDFGQIRRGHFAIDALGNAVNNGSQTNQLTLWEQAMACTLPLQVKNQISQRVSIGLRQVGHQRVDRRLHVHFVADIGDPHKTVPQGVGDQRFFERAEEQLQSARDDVDVHLGDQRLPFAAQKTFLIESSTHKQRKSAITF